MSDKWYAPGLNFKCTGCGGCCTGAPGYVWVTEEEIEEMATYVRLSKEQFMVQYIRQVDGRYSLKEHSKTFDCIFLRDKRCTIYPVRPTQCRTYPWWAENLASKEGWKRAALECEGINRDAPLVPIEEIERAMGANLSLPKDVQDRVGEWLEGPYDEQTKETIRQLREENPTELINSFYKNLEFGTGGLRGILGVGPARMNKYTVRAATQGFATYLLNNSEQTELKVVIGYDSRHSSREFAQETAKVLAGNNIKALIFSELRPTPMVSFACRELKCAGAVMITASHNPSNYNGYKVYWSDAAQVLPPHDEGIIQEVDNITSPNQVKVANNDSPLIEEIGTELDDRYLSKLAPLQLHAQQNQAHGGELRIVYTSLHGTGITLVPSALERWGFTALTTVDSQCEPDPNFPTAPFPNPEQEETLRMGMDQLMAENGDLLLATDPDADRVGAVVMHHGDPVQISGQEMACLALHHILDGMDKKMPANPAVVKTIVTTELFTTIAAAYQCAVFDVLPGFKYIGALIDRWEETEEYTYLFGGEESYGYLVGTHARDKDAVVMCCLIAEMALEAKLQNKTLVDVLHDLYMRYGIYRSQVRSLTFEGKQGAEKIRSMMSLLRKNPPVAIGEHSVVAVEDYLTKKKWNVVEDTYTDLSLPPTNALIFWLEDQSKLVIRPSGTEPKIKLYGGAVHVASKPLQEGIDQCETKLQQLLDGVEKLLQSA